MATQLDIRKAFEDRIRGLVRRKARQLERLAVSTLLLFVGLVALVFGLADVQIKADTAGRLAGFLLILLGTVGLLVFWLRSLRREKRSFVDTAARVEERTGGMNSVLHTATEMSLDRSRAEQLSSAELVDAVIEEAERQSAGVPAERFVQRRYVVLFHLLAMLVTLTIGAFALGYPRVFRTAAMRLFMPWRDLPPPTLTELAVSPGNAECSQYSTFTVSAQLKPDSYRVPEKVMLDYAVTKTGNEESGAEWITESMLPAADGQFTYTFKRVDQSLKYRVRGGDYQSPVYALSVFIPPKVAGIDMRLIYPEYTQMREKSFPDCLGPITAIRGTEVRLHVRANTVLGACRAEFDQGPTVEGQVHDNEADLSFTVQSNDRYRIIVTDRTGHSNVDNAVSYSIRALEDQAPSVTVKQPGINLKLTKTAEVPLQIEAEDDFGISEIGIAYKIKEEYEQRVTLQQFNRILRQAQTSHTLMLENFWLADTDIVTYYAYAIDNDVVSGRHEATSKLYFIEIRPYGQRYREAPQMGGGGQQQQQKKKGLVEKLDEMIEKQKKILSETFAIDRAARRVMKYSDQQQMGLSNLETRQDDLRQRLHTLGRNLTQRLAQQRLYEHIDRLGQIGKAVDQMGLAVYMLGMFDSRNAYMYENQSLYHLYRAKRDIEHMISKAQSGEERKRLEQALEQSMQSYRRDVERQREDENDQLKKHAQNLEQLRKQQANLNQNLQQHARDKLKAQRNQSGSPSERERQTQMDKSADRQSELAEKALQEYSAMRETQSMNPRVGQAQLRELTRAYHEMSQTRDNLNKYKPQEARDHGQKAEKRLEDALKRVRESMQRGLGEQLDSVARHARELAQKQQEMAAESGKQQSSSEQRKEQQHQQENWNDLTEKARETAERLKNTDPELARKMESAVREMQDEALQRKLEEAKDSLARRQQQEARKAQSEAARQMQRQAGELDEVAREYSMDESTRLADAFKRAQKLAREQKDVADRLEPREAGQPAPKADRKLQEKQQELAQRTGDLSKKIDRLSAVQETDLRKSVQSALQSAEKAMTKSAESMPRQQKEAQQQARKAHGEMKRVEESLKRLLNQSLNQELAEVTETARQAEQQQQAARRSTQKMVEQDRRNAEDLRPQPSNVQMQMAIQQQQKAGETAEKLEKKMKDLVKRSETADKELAQRMRDALKNLEPAQTKKEMTNSTWQLSAQNPSAAKSHQEKALKKLKSTRKRLEDTQKDRTPLLAQKLKNLQDETQKLGEQARAEAKRLAEQAQKAQDQKSPQAQKDSKGKPGEREGTAEKLSELVDRTEALRKRMEYVEPRREGEQSPRADERRTIPKEWKQLVENVEKELESSRQRYARGQDEQARDGLKRASRGFQVLSEGIIEKLDRLSSRQQRSTPGLQRVPTRYRKLVESYYRALSEEK